MMKRSVITIDIMKRTSWKEQLLGRDWKKEKVDKKRKGLSLWILIGWSYFIIMLLYCVGICQRSTVCLEWDRARDTQTQDKCQQKNLSLSLSLIPTRRRIFVLQITYDTRIQDFLTLSVPLHTMFSFHAPTFAFLSRHIHSPSRWLMVYFL